MKIFGAMEGTLVFNAIILTKKTKNYPKKYSYVPKKVSNAIIQLFLIHVLLMLDYIPTRNGSPDASRINQKLVKCRENINAITMAITKCVRQRIE